METNEIFNKKYWQFSNQIIINLLFSTDKQNIMSMDTSMKFKEPSENVRGALVTNGVFLPPRLILSQYESKTNSLPGCQGGAPLPQSASGNYDV